MLNYYLRPRKHQSIDRMFDDFFSPIVSARQMTTDVTETETEYLFDIELPGYSKDDVKISYKEGYLKVEANREQENESNEKNYITKERYVGSVSRSWYIGNVDQASIKAGFNDGVLTVTVPKEQLPKEDEKNYISID